MRFFYATVWTGFILLHSIKVGAKQIVVGVTLGIMVLLAEFVPWRRLWERWRKTTLS